MKIIDEHNNVMGMHPEQEISCTAGDIQKLITDAQTAVRLLNDTLDKAHTQAEDYDRFWCAMGVLSLNVSVDDAIVFAFAMKQVAEAMLKENPLTLSADLKISITEFREAKKRVEALNNQKVSHFDLPPVFLSDLARAARAYFNVSDFSHAPDGSCHFCNDPAGHSLSCDYYIAEKNLLVMLDRIRLGK